MNSFTDTFLAGLIIISFLSAHLRQKRTTMLVDENKLNKEGQRYIPKDEQSLDVTATQQVEATMNPQDDDEKGNTANSSCIPKALRNRMLVAHI